MATWKVRTRDTETGDPARLLAQVASVSTVSRGHPSLVRTSFLTSVAGWIFIIFHRFHGNMLKHFTFHTLYIKTASSLKIFIIIVNS
jgi:hypothetical protein